MWEERLRRFEGMEEQLKMNAIERSLMILHAAGNIHAKTLTNYINQIRGLLEEAQDNVKFLSTIRKPTQVLVTSVDFKEMRTTLPNLMNSLRNIWMLSKHFNTDDQICGLLDKITNIILARVRGFVDFKLLHTPEEAERISKESQSLLTGWDESFRKTRRAIGTILLKNNSLKFLAYYMSEFQNIAILLVLFGPFWSLLVQLEPFLTAPR